jgi:hypothetical protein
MKLSAFICLSLTGSFFLTAPKAKAAEHRWNQTAMGPTFGSSLFQSRSDPNGSFSGIPKATAIWLGDESNSSIGFDADNLSMFAGWTDGFVYVKGGRDALLDHDEIRGKVSFITKGPGWTQGGEWKERPTKYGPLPREWAKYRGLYHHGERIVLNYTVGTGEVLESPWAEKTGDSVVFSRSFEIRGFKNTESILLAQSPQGGGVGQVREVKGVKIAIVPRSKRKGDATVIAATVLGEDNSIGVDAHRIIAKVKAGTSKFTILLWEGPEKELDSFALYAKKKFISPDLGKWMKGGPRKWAENLETIGELGIAKKGEPYALDTIQPPFDNPWRAILHFGGHDFFANGDLAVSTMEGDVWLVRGIDDKLDKLTWQRIATGLYHPLGLRIVDGKIYVLGRDQITRLHDLNGDSEIDFYENFNNDAEISLGSHEYSTCLETDPAGNFYYITCASGTRHGGSVLKVTKDGGKLERFATGFRNPNGFFVGPGGVVTAADQQGTWVPASRVDIVEPGGFYGFIPCHHREEKPETYDGPLCWIPHKEDNSCGSQVWVTSDKWGLPKGELLHLSYGKCQMFLVMKDKVNGTPQGAVSKFPFRFASGAMRGRFSDRDGQLYVTGLKGWQTSGARDGCLQRVRYVGGDWPRPLALNAHNNGVLLRFGVKLDEELANDPESYAVHHWNYRWTSQYGSPDYKVSNPDKTGRDKLKVLSAKLQPNGKSVFIEIEGIQPVMQMEIAYDLENDNGDELVDKVHNTIHKLRSKFGVR